MSFHLHSSHKVSENGINRPCINVVHPIMSFCCKSGTTLFDWHIAMRLTYSRLVSIHLADTQCCKYKTKIELSVGLNNMRFVLY